MERQQPPPEQAGPQNPNYEWENITLEAVQHMIREAYRLDREPGKRDIDPFRELDGLMDALPGENIERAREIFKALATSENADDREVAALAMESLTQYDNELGSDLWVKLLKDHGDAGDAALEAMLNAKAGEEGLSRDDFARLAVELAFEVSLREPPRP